MCLPYYNTYICMMCTIILLNALHLYKNKINIKIMRISI